MKRDYDIEGMHCRSCEILIEGKVGQIPGVDRVSADSKKGKLSIESKKEVSDEAISKMIKETEYRLIKSKTDTKVEPDYDYRNFMIALLIFGTFLIVGYETNIINIFSAKPKIGSSLITVFLVGLAAGFSTCMAVVGGLVLGLSSKYSNQHPDLNPLQKIKPQLIFNLGRIVFFSIFGGILGLGGSILQLSGFSLGIITLILGIYLLFLGIKLLGFFPNLIDRLTLPKSISKKFKIGEKSNQAYTNTNAFVLGGLTFFLPCGFTQAVQVFALASGKFTTGAIMMGVFALGTTPGLITIGSLSAFLKEGNISRIFFKTVGLLLIFLAWVNLGHGLTQSGVTLPKLGSNQTSTQTDNSLESAPLEDGKQVIKMDQYSTEYRPNYFILKRGVPTKWIITANDIGSCSSFLTVPELGIKKFLDQKENVIEFTPEKFGKIRFSCSMGMYSGTFEVIP